MFHSLKLCIHPRLSPLALILLTGVWLLLGGHAGTAPESANLLENGDFRIMPQPGDPVPGWQLNEALQLQYLQVEPGAGREGSPALACRPMITTQSGLSQTERNAGKLTQRVAVEPGQSYVLLAWVRMDEPVIGTSFSIGGQRVHYSGSREWRLVSVPYENDTRSEVDVRVIMANRGERRITIGATLYIDSILLVPVSEEGNLHLPGSGEAAVATTIETAPGLYYLWVRAWQPEDMAHYTLRAGSEQRDFRGYTGRETYWLRPVLPELFLPEGALDLHLEASQDTVRIEEVVLTRDQFWKPEGADAFLAAGAAFERQQAAGFEPVAEASLPLRVIGATPGEASWPVTQGLPFPRGVLGSARHVRRADGQPLQTETLTRWPDGSVQWLLLNSMARGGQDLLLEYGTAVVSPEAAAPLTIRDTPDAVEVDTGALRFSVPRDGSALLRDIESETTRIDRVDSTVDGRFTSNHSGIEVTVEEQGPVRAAIRIQGDYLDADGEQRLSFQLRIHAYAGRDVLELEPVFTLTEDVISYDLEQVTWRLFRPSDSVRLYPGEAAIERGLGPDKQAVVWRAGIRDPGAARNTFPYTISQGAEEPVEGVEGRGRLVLAGPAGPLALHIVDFWQNAPKALRIDDEALEIDLLDGPLTFYNGMSKTHRIALDLGGGQDWLDLVKERPLLLATPDWYGESLALTSGFSAQDRAGYPLIERAVDAIFDFESARQLADARVPGFGGLIHFGDRMMGAGPPPTALNLETALGQSTVIQLLRSQDRDRYLPFLDRAIRHFLDIDIDHSRSSEGGIFVHAPHVRTTLDPGPRTHGHSWFDGTYHYGLLMGWRRVLDITPAVGAHYAARRHSFDSLHHYWRSLAWKAKSVLCAFSLTQDPGLLEACQRDIRVTAHQRDFLSRHGSAYQFSIGAAVLRRYEALTGDPAVRELFLQMVDARLPQDLRKPTPDIEVYDTLPAIDSRDLALLNELAQAWRWTGDDRYLRYGAARLNRLLSFGAGRDPSLVWGGAAFLAALRETGIEETALPYPGGAQTMCLAPHLPVPDRPQQVFQLEREDPAPMELLLFQAETQMRAAGVEVTVYDPSGEQVAARRFQSGGRQLYRIPLPAGAAGRYTVVIHLEDYLRWTVTPVVLDLTGRAQSLRDKVVHLRESTLGALYHPLFDAEPGRITMELTPRFGAGRARLDKLVITPFDTVPFQETPFPAETRVIRLAELDLPAGWERWPDREASGGYVIGHPGPGSRSATPEPLRVTVDLEAGRYRLFIRCWWSLLDTLDIRVSGSPDEAQPLPLQVFHMDARRLGPRWALAFKPAEAAQLIADEDIVWQGAE